MGEYAQTQSFMGGKKIEINWQFVCVFWIQSRSTDFQLSKNNIAHNNICRFKFQDGIMYGCNVFFSYI